MAEHVSLNAAGVSHARSLIASGKVNKSDSWSITAADEDKMLGKDDWEAYSSWHLGKRDEADPKTKGAYAYPFGKDGEVYRKAIIAIKSRAAQQGVKSVYEAASKLLEEIDGSDSKAKLVYANAVDLAPLAPAGDEPWPETQRVQVLPWGKIEARHPSAPWYVNEANAKAIIDDFNRRTTDYPVSWDHYGPPKGTPSAMPVPAAGWIEAREIVAPNPGEKTDPTVHGVYDTIRWNAKAREALKAREFRYYSPEMWHDKEGNILAIQGGGLTNYPAIHGMLPVAAKAEESAPQCGQDLKARPPVEAKAAYLDDLRSWRVHENKVRAAAGKALVTPIEALQHVIASWDESTSPRTTVGNWTSDADAATVRANKLTQDATEASLNACDTNEPADHSAAQSAHDKAMAAHLAAAKLHEKAGNAEAAQRHAAAALMHKRQSEMHNDGATGGAIAAKYVSEKLVASMMGATMGTDAAWRGRKGERGMEELLKELGFSSLDEAKAALAEMTALKAAAKETDNAVAKATAELSKKLDDAVKQIEELKAAKNRAEVEAKIIAAKSAGKVTAENEAFARELAEKDSGMFDKWLAVQPATAKVPAGRLGITPDSTNKATAALRLNFPMASEVTPPLTQDDELSIVEKAAVMAKEQNVELDSPAFGKLISIAAKGEV